MTSRYLVDPELALMLDNFPQIDLTIEGVQQMRAQMVALVAQSGPPAPDFPDVEVREQRVPGPPDAPEVRVLVYRPKNVAPPLPALLWIRRRRLRPGQRRH